MKKVGRKAIALLLCAVMICSVLSSLTVSAAGNGGGESETFISSLLKSTKTVCLNKAVSWALDGFMNAMFTPEDSEEVTMLKDIQKQLGDVLAGQQKIMDELKALEGLIEVQSYIDKINDFTDALNQCEPFFQCYDTLIKLDTTYEGQPDVLKMERLRTLTDGLGITSMTSIGSEVDNKYLKLYSTFVGPLSYTVNKQVISDGDLFDVFREIKRYQYCWENEAWDEMESFFNYAASAYALVSMIEVASVEARIERCNIHNDGLTPADINYWSTAALNNWLYNDGGLAADTDLESRVDAGEKVYSDHPVARQNIYRYFWKAGYEVRVYAEINNLGSHPVNEPLAGKGGTSADTNFSKTGGMRIKREGEKANPVEEFWNKFYTSENITGANLITTDIVNNMLTACGHNRSLIDIIKAGDFIISDGTDVNDMLGMVLKKDDAKNPYKIDESHDSVWVEYGGTRYTDKITPLVKYAPSNQTNDIGSGKAASYKTYYYYHTSDGSVRWYVNDVYTKGSLGQLYLYEDTCMHTHLTRVDLPVETTCKTAGKTSDWHCEDCGKTLKGLTIPKLPHNIPDTWYGDNEKHWKQCTVCGEKFEAGAHHSTTGVILLSMYKCDECGLFYAKPIFAKPPKSQTPSDEKAGADTGDAFDMFPFAVFASVSLLGIIVCTCLKRKKKT